MNGETGNIKGIPYGIADYELIRSDNYYYVDKTPYLKSIKKAGRYLFFIRPRRFGKSLFISLMEAYFDIIYKDRFEEFFKGTWIYDNSTDERNKYLVLTFNFSLVDPAPVKMEASFLDHVRGAALDFIDKYGEYLTPDTGFFTRTIEESRSASDILSNLLRLCKRSHRKLYVIIDEYDNFSNILLSTAGKKAYQDLTHGTGFFRSFFNVLKGGASGTGAPITRSFITGVSPITMDDVTSGYNIGKNVSLESFLNRMLGFSEADVIEMIEYYRSKGRISHPTAELLAIMIQWYGNYRFSKKDDVTMFNSDMVLYFLDNYMTEGELPEDLIDRNVRIDYGKLRHLIIIDRDDAGKGKRPATNGNFSKLKKIIEEGGTTSAIAGGFPLEQLVDTKNFKSLLYYFGLLSVEAPERDKVRLRIPNETVKRLYYDYIEEAYRETGIFALDLAKYADLMTELAYDGKWKPLFEFLASRMRESMSLRDLITGEKSIQAFLNVYLGLSQLYIIHTEKELNKGYCDIFAEPFLARYEGIGYSYLIEIKYLKAGLKPGEAGVPAIRQLIEEAENQLERYARDEKFQKALEKTTLIKLLLVFSGHELVHICEVG